MGMQVTGVGNFSIRETSPPVSAREEGPVATWDRSHVKVKLGTMLVDGAVVLAGFSLGFLKECLMGGEGASAFTGHEVLFLTVSVVIMMLSSYAHGLYDATHRRLIADEVFPIIRAQVLATLLLCGVVHICGSTIMSPWMIAATGITNIGLLTGWRMLIRMLVARHGEPGCRTCNVLIMGGGEVGRAIADYIVTAPEHGYHLVGYLDTRKDRPGVIGDPQDFSTIVRSHFIDVLFITPPSDRDMVKALISEAQQLNVGVQIVPDFFDGLAENSPIEHLGGFPVQVVHRSRISCSTLLIKRAVDVAVSAAALLILLPVLLVVAIIVRLDSDGPILYRAERVGRKGRRFLCYKFRTMVANAEDFKDQLRHLNEREGVLFKIREDPRITRAGRFLRKYSFDELPQLWNVFKGDMSLVGPRPPVSSEVNMYSLEHLERLNVTPGLTGLWQVTSRQDPSFNTYFACDREYIRTWSPLLDLKLLLKTIPAVLKGSGE